MNRKGFISSLLGSLGAAALGQFPKSWVKQYQKIYLLQCFVAGFGFYHGPSLLQQIQEGDMLELVREPENEHDSCAIALHFNGQKIGYIPQQENALFSKLMDGKLVELMAEVTHLKTEAATWEHVAIAVYGLREVDEPLPGHSHYLTQLETPHYRSLKYRNNRVARVFYEDEIS